MIPDPDADPDPEPLALAPADAAPASLADDGGDRCITDVPDLIVVVVASVALAEVIATGDKGEGELFG